ncbi:MAG TPA: hypothetical protein VJU58_12060, partial [Microbacterium sp.]|nr:hypothetical protein [Microbacterium sp.]
GETLAKRKSVKKPQADQPEEDLDSATSVEPSPDEERDPDDEAGELIPQDILVCPLTGELKPDKPEERVLQSLVEQLHREYLVDLEDMERDVKVSCLNEEGKKKTVTVAIAVYEHGKPHELENLIRVVLIAKANAKVSDATINQLDLVLSNSSVDRAKPAISRHLKTGHFR